MGYTAACAVAVSAVGRMCKNSRGEMPCLPAVCTSAGQIPRVLIPPSERFVKEERQECLSSSYTLILEDERLSFFRVA
jgi:hypothetical protein